jgi:hypothetical protein
MQTFLPYEDIQRSVKVLDNKRLGKQRVEAMQIINVLTGQQKTKGWINHPAVKMWEGYVSCLMLYTNTCIFEWIDRGFKNTMQVYPGYLYGVAVAPPAPWWLGNEDFHRAMRSRLIEKNEEFYLPIFTKIDKGFNDGKYFWPVNETQTFRVI